MCYAKYLLDSFALEKLSDVVRHILIGESGQVDWVIRTTTTQQVRHDKSIPSA